ncbi:class I SAM-dependent methyltransferase [Streptomyces griseiscabiei]|uniref:Class I SAM-dependent methyltransferase n=1 Tax=Streptomyces griseiscabiei TaxID=2993540 RepID=A0ABU4L3R4_9ACTN|nr:class I SAM-dependent methyltransferase [Streptomyces griseiscabiei]MBZ3905277.1 class I SAM-dependent methyltransferase [Streptomyces griseiscabiei]MDX2910363.1 class I SAM-dependent methyltransferase [Streptomyces griseiscabiei]
MVEPAAHQVTRDAYDAVASLYAETFRETLRDRPLDRAILGVFAEAVRETGGDGGDGGSEESGRNEERRVADLGCGPGYVTAHLAGLGLAVFGVDASPAMIELAREACPGLRFDVGSMQALDIADGELDGVLSRWSVIHLPPPELPAVLAEFHRVLAPGGHLLIGFSASEDASHPTQVYDHAVAPAYRWWPDHLAALLRDTGLDEVARMVREPQPTDRRQFREVQLLARKAPTDAA